MFLLYCDYVQRLACVLMVYAALGGLSRVESVCRSSMRTCCFHKVTRVKLYEQSLVLTTILFN